MAVESDMRVHTHILFINFIYIIERKHKKQFCMKCGFNTKWKNNKVIVISLSCKISLKRNYSIFVVVTNKILFLNKNRYYRVIYI